MPGIAHKDLTDPQLHEPKGASTALLGSVPFSDGAGSTVWKVIQPDEMIFDREAVADASASTVTNGSTISTAGMSAITDGTIADAANFTNTNKNIKELATKYNDLVVRFNTLLAEHQSLIGSVNALIGALKTSNLITGV